MKVLLTLSVLFLSLTATAKSSLVVAVVDTGIDKNLTHLCPTGHRSFVNHKEVDASGSPNVVSNDPLDDPNGHGTHVAGLINRNAKSDDYCLLSLVYYDSSNNDSSNNLTRLREALKYAIALKVDFINISGGGESPDSEERQLIKIALSRGITIVVAAGNNGWDLSKGCNFFPACYDDRIVVVGSLLPSGNQAPSSNYGKPPVNRWEVGISVLSDLPGGRTGTMSGTSQAAAVATGKLVKARSRKR